MTRHRIAQVLAGVSAFGFFLAAGLHTAGYRQVVLQAEQGFSGLGSLVAALWLAFDAAMVVLGGIVTVVALGRVARARWVLTLAGSFPFVTVLLQLHFLGFTRPTAILSTIAAVSFGAAIVCPSVSQPVGVGAA